LTRCSTAGPPSAGASRRSSVAWHQRCRRHRHAGCSRADSARHLHAFSFFLLFFSFSFVACDITTIYPPTTKSTAHPTRIICMDSVVAGGKPSFLFATLFSVAAGIYIRTCCISLTRSFFFLSFLLLSPSPRYRMLLSSPAFRRHSFLSFFPSFLPWTVFPSAQRGVITHKTSRFSCTFFYSIFFFVPWGFAFSENYDIGDPARGAAVDWGLSNVGFFSSSWVWVWVWFWIRKHVGWWTHTNIQDRDSSTGVAMAVIVVWLFLGLVLVFLLLVLL